MRPGIRQFEIQAQVLNSVRKSRDQIQFELMDGNVIGGIVKAFDTYCIIIQERGLSKTTLLYKHAISRIVFESDHFKGE